MKSDQPYLGHIADSIAAIENYVAGGRDAFMKERLVQDAVIRNFEVIGEAATRLSPPVHDRSRDVWSKVIAFRNRLIHGYWNVDLLLVLGRRRERPASFEDRGGQHTGRAF